MVDYQYLLDTGNQRQSNSEEIFTEKLILSQTYFKLNLKRPEYILRNAKTTEFPVIGSLMVEVYSQLKGFPGPLEQPNYYKMLANIGEFTQKPKTELLVAVSEEGNVVGGVVYFADMKFYGSGGTATQEKNASGFRLLAVDPSARGFGIGKLLTIACINKTATHNNDQLIIHSTLSMQIAWKMYDKMGFKRSKELDFMQGDLPVFGFRMKIGDW